jgi:glycine dehydrogenase subunit 1
MPFIPHTEREVDEMLATIGVDSIDDLFDEIPSTLRCGPLSRVPEGMSELGVARLMHARAAQDAGAVCFVGAGAYDHHIPAAVWELATRGEFYSAYTPYQAEASQGTLQLIYEFQSMMAALTGLDVSNASLYDGASALAEAVLMAVRANRKSKSRRVLMPETVHPAYRQVVSSIVGNQGIELVELTYDRIHGYLDPARLNEQIGQDHAALVISQPNFFGALEEVGALTDWAHAQGMLVIGVVNPVSLALLQAPGAWGETGADIVCGEGQPLGVPLASGGPYFGFMCCKRDYMRQMPGRIVGRTLDLDGNPGYTLTLQAREQHIRRSKATSNICTNQGLLVTAATIHLSILGAEGLRAAASASHRNARRLLDSVTRLGGVRQVFDRPFFHEVVLRLDAPVESVMRAMAVQNVLVGYSLGEYFPELENCILVCATEKRTEEDIERYVQHLERILSKLSAATCPVKPKF